MKKVAVVPYVTFTVNETETPEAYDTVTRSGGDDMTANRKTEVRSGPKGGWMARAIASLVLGVLCFPVGLGGIFQAVRGDAAPLEIFVSLVLCLVCVASFRGMIRSLKHYKQPSSLIMDDAGIEVADVYQTRRWAWTDILGATTGRGTIFITLIVRRSPRSHSYVDIGPWPKGTLEDILAQRAAR